MQKELKNRVRRPVAMPKNNFAPANESEYRQLMADIEQLVMVGNGSIRKEDLGTYASLAKAAAEYEQNVYTVPHPKTIEGLLEWKMFELKLKQKSMAEKLHVSESKLSLVMSGKQKPGTALLKSIHTEFGIDDNVLLGMV